MLQQPVELLNLLHQWKMNTLKHVLLKCISSGDKSRKHYQHLAKNIDKYVCYNIFYNNGIISKQVVYKRWINKFWKGTTFKCFRNNFVRNIFLRILYCSQCTKDWGNLNSSYNNAKKKWLKQYYRFLFWIWRGQKISTFSKNKVKMWQDLRKLHRTLIAE